MLFENIHYLDENFQIKRGYIQVEGALIRSITPHRPADYRGPVWDGADYVLMPGLINSHSHIPMTLLRGYGEGLPLDRWLREKVWPFEDQLSEQGVYYATLLGIAEMLSGGTTSFSDMYFWCDAIMQAVLDTGIKANISRSASWPEDVSINQINGFSEAFRLYNKCNGAANGRVLVDFSIHAQYTSQPRATAEMAEAIRECGAVVQIHISETQKEHEECKARWGKTPTQYFYDLGVFGNPVTAAHCVYVEPEDMAIMAGCGATAVHNPSSNLKLGSGIAPIQALQNAGVRVALGTDGAASNNNLNMFEELHLTALIHKGVHRAPTHLSNGELLRMATVNGALQQGRKNTGLIRQGYAADLVAVQLKAPHLQPYHDIGANLLYSVQASDVALTMVDGQVLYEHGRFANIDLDKIIEEVQRETGRILSIVQSQEKHT